MDIQRGDTIRLSSIAAEFLTRLKDVDGVVTEVRKTRILVRFSNDEVLEVGRSLIQKVSEINL